MHLNMHWLFFGEHVPLIDSCFLSMAIHYAYGNFSINVHAPTKYDLLLCNGVADLEIFGEGFSFTKMPAKTWSEDQKKKRVITSFLSHFLLAAASLPFNTAPKTKH